MTFFFISHLILLFELLWKPDEPAAAEPPPVSGAQLTRAVPYETPVGPSLGAGAQHFSCLVYIQAGPAPTFPLQKLKADP